MQKGLSCFFGSVLNTSLYTLLSRCYQFTKSWTWVKKSIFPSLLQLRKQAQHTQTKILLLFKLGCKASSVVLPTLNPTPFWVLPYIIYICQAVLKSTLMIFFKKYWISDISKLNRKSLVFLLVVFILFY